MKKLTTEEFIKKAVAKHGDRYLYDHVKYVNTRTKILVTCKEHGDFLITPNEHLQGGGCPVCNKSTKKTIKEFIEEAKKNHGDKYDYSKVEYVNTNSKVCIICPEHGEFWMTPKQHLRGQGCRKCSFKKISEKFMPSKDEFIKKAINIHGKKYDYSKVKYRGNKEKVCIICPKHGEFLQTPNQHLRRSGCPKCANENNSKRQLLTVDEFIKKSRNTHGDKYDYSKIEYKNAHEKVCIICPEHGEFWQMPYSHINGKGCPKCNESKLEEKIRILLEEHKISYIAYCNNKVLPFLKKYTLDFYLPDHKIAIECQGEQHFKPIKHFGGEDTFIETCKRDKIKNDLCNKNGIKLLYFSNINANYPYKIINAKEDIINEIKNG